MLTPAVKQTLKIIFVVVVIAGLMFSYVFMGTSNQPQPTAQQPTERSFNFAGPTTEPAVNGPSGAPSANGPSAPPPGGSL